MMRHVEDAHGEGNENLLSQARDLCYLSALCFLSIIAVGMGLRLRVEDDAEGEDDAQSDPA